MSRIQLTQLYAETDTRTLYAAFDRAVRQDRRTAQGLGWDLPGCPETRFVVLLRMAQELRRRTRYQNHACLGIYA